MILCDKMCSFLQILNCAIPVWYDQFKNITFKRCEISPHYFLNTNQTILLYSAFIPLSSEFVSYLRADGVVLPHGSVYQCILVCN